jgi:hypothetical protein
LIAYFNEDRLKELIEIATVETPTSPELLSDYRLTYLANRLLSIQGSPLLRLIFKSSDLLSKLFQFLDSSEEVGFTLAGYFEKIFFAMFNQYPGEMLEYVFITSP